MELRVRTWLVNANGEKRLRSHHPWIFVSELKNNPQEASVGDCIELKNEKGNFLAFGIANPKSQIAVRVLSFRKDFVWNLDAFCERLVDAWKRRVHMGYELSYRVCYGEADSLPGLIADFYSCGEEKPLTGVLVLQLQGAAMESLVLKNFPKLQEKLAQKVSEFSLIPSAENLQIVLNQKSKSRAQEGLSVVKAPELPANFADPSLCWLQKATGEGAVVLETSIRDGQKTGLFLDQATNIRNLAQLLKNRKQLKVLDLCCYVGQWSAQLVASLGAPNFQQVSLADVSKEALARSEGNVLRNSSGSFSVKTHLLDVMDDWASLESETFDVVICDPPAFVKNRKDLQVGLAGYEKLFLKAAKQLSPHGILVLCSCSGNVSDQAFDEVVRSVVLKSGKNLQVVHRGGHGADHPTLPAFPEGKYLKCAIFAAG